MLRCFNRPPPSGLVTMVFVVRSAAATFTKVSVPISRHFRPTTDFRRPFPLPSTIIQRSRFGTTFPRFAEPSPIPGSPAPPPTPRSKVILQRCVTGLRWSSYLVASTALGICLIGGGVFIHDAFTYTDKHVSNVPVNPLALCPTTGGPKNLPIASSLVGDEEDEEAKALATKPRLVIVGGGWGVSKYSSSESSLPPNFLVPGRQCLAKTQTNGLSRYHRLTRHLHQLHAFAPVGCRWDCSSSKSYRASTETSRSCPWSFRLRVGCRHCIL